MSRTRQMLCVFYGLVALIALVATWSQNLAYFIGDTPPPTGCNTSTISRPTPPRAPSPSISASSCWPAPA